MARKKQILFDIPQDSFWWRLDPLRFQQVFNNLYSNAIKFCHPNGRVKTSWEIKDGLLLISVSDNGIGMDSKKLNTLFDPFQKTSSLGTLGEAGTGYGLPLVEQIVSLHHGEISVESTQAKGTTFTIKLPK